MQSIPISARNILDKQEFEASAPCRIDSGGTWDIKAIALPFERIEPATVNMALNLRTSVKLLPFRDKWVKVSSKGFPGGEEYLFEDLPFNSNYGIFLGTLSYFGVHGIHVKIESDSPVKSALGGSSTALVALIKALSKLFANTGGRELSRLDILHLGYHIEDGLSGGNCGIQDQAIAVYGGVNKWTWSYGKRDQSLKRESLVENKDLMDFSDHILVAYSGKNHVSSHTNRAWVDSFLTGKTRSGWIKVNEIVHKFSLSIKEKDWESAIGHLKDEMMIRREITPEAVIPITERLIDEAEDAGCGARFTGAGAGGSVWSMGNPDNIARLKRVWENTLKHIKGARILNCALDSAGVS